MLYMPARPSYQNKIKQSFVANYTFGHVVPWRIVLIAAFVICLLPLTLVALLPFNAIVANLWWVWVLVVDVVLICGGIIGFFIYKSNYVIDVKAKRLLKPGFYLSKSSRYIHSIDIKHITDVQIMHRKGKSLDERLFSSREPAKANEKSSYTKEVTPRLFQKSRAQLRIKIENSAPLEINTLDSKDAAHMGRLLLQIRYSDEVMELLKKR